MTEITDKDMHWVTEIHYINETKGDEEHLLLHSKQRDYAEIKLDNEVCRWFGKIFNNEISPEMLIGHEQLYLDSNGIHKPVHEITIQRIEIMQQLLNIRRYHGRSKETFSARVYKKKKDVKRKLYSVLFTSYEDDYKHRYDNGVYPDETRLFSTKEKANNFINQELCERIFEQINDQNKK